MNNSFDFFDAIFCINLDKRPDRWVHAQEQFKKIGILVNLNFVGDNYLFRTLDGGESWKKLSLMPTCFTPSTSAQISASACSTDVLGAAYACSSSGLVYSGVGRAR